MRPNKPGDLWRYVQKSGARECWPFTGSTFRAGYGRFFIGCKSVLAHRIAYALTHGEPPAPMLVMHKCNNKLCCNPAHLTLGSNSENQRHASASNAFRVGATGIKGVSFDKKRNYWTAQGYLSGKKRNLYTGPHKSKAIAARAQWERKVGVSFNLGKD